MANGNGNGNGLGWRIADLWKGINTILLTLILGALGIVSSNVTSFREELKKSEIENVKLQSNQFTITRELDDHEIRLDNIEQGKHPSTSQRYTREDAHEEHDQLRKEWKEDIRDAVK